MSLMFSKIRFPCLGDPKNAFVLFYFLKKKLICHVWDVIMVESVFCLVAVCLGCNLV